MDVGLGPCDTPTRFCPLVSLSSTFYSGLAFLTCMITPPVLSNRKTYVCAPLLWKEENRRGSSDQAGRGAGRGGDGEKAGFCRGQRCDKCHRGGARCCCCCFRSFLIDDHTVAGGGVDINFRLVRRPPLQRQRLLNACRRSFPLFTLILFPSPPAMRTCLINPLFPHG